MIIKPDKPEELLRFLKSRPLVLYGMGDTGLRIAKWCDGHGVSYLFADKNAASLKKNSGKSVLTAQSLVDEHHDTNIVVSSIVYNKEITEDLLALGIERARIFPYSLFMPDEVSLIELEENGLVNWERMRERCGMISEWGWIPASVKTVVDYSAGENLIMKDFLPPNAGYYPVDYMDRGGDTVVCDFSKGQFPDIYAELSVCLAMIMYTTLAEELVANICGHTGHTAIFSAITIEGFPDVGARRRSGMLIDLTERQIVDMFGSHRFKLNDKKYHSAGNSTMTFFLFEKCGDLN